MEGVEPVDELMIPVLQAISRNVSKQEAITDIYNRAYEAVLNALQYCDAVRAENYQLKKEIGSYKLTIKRLTTGQND